MDVAVTFRHMEPTDALKQYVDEKVSKIANERRAKGEERRIIFNPQSAQQSWWGGAQKVSRW